MAEPVKLLPIPPPAEQEVKKRKRRARIPLRQRAAGWVKAKREAASRLWAATDIRDRLFFPGVALIGLGVYQLRPAVAAIVIGAILILAVRPLRSWF